MEKKALCKIGEHTIGEWASRCNIPVVSTFELISLNDMLDNKSASNMRIVRNNLVAKIHAYHKKVFSVLDSFIVRGTKGKQVMKILNSNHIEDISNVLVYLATIKEWQSLISMNPSQEVRYQKLRKLVIVSGVTRFI